MAKLPAIQFYPDDWLRDQVAGCSLAAQGLWLRMMIVAHDSNPYGHIVVPEWCVARMCGATLDEYRSLLAELESKSVVCRRANGQIYFPQLIQNARRPRRSQVEKIRAWMVTNRRRVMAAIIRRDGYGCAACKAIDRIEIDHKRPVSKGGNNALDNLWLLCQKCNRSKGARHA